MWKYLLAGEIMGKNIEYWKESEHSGKEKGYKHVTILEKVLQNNKKTDIMQTVMIPGRSIFA